MADIKLGGTIIKDGVMLAPMAGSADHAMRRICRDNGAPYAVTEMISAKALCFRDRKTASLAAILDDDTPLAVQLFGSEPDIVAAAAYQIARCSYEGCATSLPPAAIDINMGCPATKIVRNGEGSALMKDPGLAREIIASCANALSGTGIPLTVKLRSGWDENKNAARLAADAEAAGAAMICIHGRTREQQYAPPVDLDIIRDVCRAVSIPVIGNGDIRCASDALHMLEYTGCDGIAVGRGALGNPWIFAEIRAALRGEAYSPPQNEQRLDTALEHTALLLFDKGERVGTLEARRHLAWYLRGVIGGAGGAAAYRDRIMRAASYDEMTAVIEEIRAAL